MILSTANALNLVKAKILSFGKELIDRMSLSAYSPNILKIGLSLNLQIFQYLEAFVNITISDWLNREV